MEAPIHETAVKIRELIEYLAIVYDDNQSDRSETGKICTEFRDFLKKNQNKTNSTENTSVVTKNELLAVQKLLEETKLRKKGIPGTTKPPGKCVKQPQEVRKPTKNGIVTSQVEKTTKTTKNDGGAIPKHKNISQNLTKDKTDLIKHLKTHESTVKLINSRLNGENKMSARDEFIVRVHGGRNFDFLDRKINFKDEEMCFGYKELKEVMKYNNFVFFLRKLRLDLRIFEFFVDFVVPLIERIEFEDGGLLDVVRCVLMLAKEDCETLPVFLKDDL